ncbi:MULTISPECIES: hypothetical protein [Agrobacterium]|uniref:Uncharacterized protein n=1 Tax=Agrobacterium burrii TaxID=2815339 RepID=A0ABS3EEL2_9HYPH|nr:MULTISPECIES: hypothetical protein [Agrobacterium]MBO0130399.1 hypothetical protein [Agrobacterium burrii]
MSRPSPPHPAAAIFSPGGEETSGIRSLSGEQAAGGLPAALRDKAQTGRQRTGFYDLKLLGYFFALKALLEHDFIHTIFRAMPILALGGCLM